MTFYYTNQQSARLMFYHDHAWGITRLNVYAGEAAGYLITDDTEQVADHARGSSPAADSTIPLVIQDKTFVPSQAQLAVVRRDLGHDPLGRRRQPVAAARLLAGPEPGRQLRRQPVRPLGLRPLVLAAHHGHRTTGRSPTPTTTRPATRTCSGASRR